MSTLRKGMGAPLLLALTLACFLAVPELHAQYEKKIIKNFINWNGVFSEGVDSASRQHIIRDIESQIAAVSAKPVEGVKSYKGKLTSYIRKEAKKKKIKPGRMVVRNVVTKYCSCNDTLLWNIRADVEIDRNFDSTEGSTPTVIPPKPPLRPAGEPLAILENNDVINFLNVKNASNPRAELMSVIKRRSTISQNAVIAVLDTGIDTTYMEEGLRTEILWSGAGRNMLFGADPNNYLDDYKYKHGTSVAYIAINSFYQASGNSSVPKVMVVKVLDSNATGSIFEFCCGLSYAVENHATVINASMGYYGPSDVVLDYYVTKCHNDSIPLVAAAGNSDDAATGNLVCSPVVREENRLKSPDRLFMPASLALDPVKYTVISVTGMREPGVPCYFQNFSKEFVTLGVVNRTTTGNPCCMYLLPYIDPANALEGTSFATPVVSGRLAYDIAQQGHFSNMANYLRMMNVAKAPPVNGISDAVTQENQYITY